MSVRMRRNAGSISINPSGPETPLIVARASTSEAVPDRSSTTTGVGVVSTALEVNDVVVGETMRVDVIGSIVAILHEAEDEEPLGLECPGGHAMHSVVSSAPVDGLYVPTGHGSGKLDSALQ